MTRPSRRIARAVFAAVATLGVSAVVSTALTGIVDVRHRPRGRIVRVRGGLVHLVEAGPPEADVTLVLLHGASINLEDLMLAFERTLGRRVRLIAVDRPGSGWTDRADGRTAALPSFQEEMVLAALDVIGVRRFVVLGHSWSGALAARIAVDHPDRVEGLIVISGTTQPWPVSRALLKRRHRLRLLNPFVLRGIFTPLTLLTARLMTRAIFRPQQPPPGYVGRAGVRLLARPDRFLANAEDVVFMEQGLSALAPHLHEIGVPTMIVHGDADLIVPVDQGRRLHELVRGSRYLELPGVGHMPHHAERDRVVTVIEDHLRDVVAARTESGTLRMRGR